MLRSIFWNFSAVFDEPSKAKVNVCAKRIIFLFLSFSSSNKSNSRVSYFRLRGNNLAILLLIVFFDLESILTLLASM